MSGAINSVGKLFNSTAGRVATGVVTGGLSEVGRAASGTARRSGLDPAASAALGYATGSRATPGDTLGGVPAGAPITPASSLVPPNAGGLAAASGSVNATNEESQRELDDATRLPEVPTVPGPNPDDSDEAARKRARESAQRVGGGSRRKASQLLTTLGGV